MATQSPFACNLQALSSEERSRHRDVTERLFATVLEVRELVNGYQFRVEAGPTLCLEFVEKERLCCPFFGFQIELEPEGGPLWFSLIGGPGVKPFIKAELGHTIKVEAGWK